MNSLINLVKVGSLMFIAVTLSLLSLQAQQNSLTADEIMQRVHSRPTWEDMQASMTLRLIPPEGPEQAYEMESFAKKDPETGETKMLIVFTAPPEVAGIEFLLHEHKDRDDDIWLYLPALGQAKKVVASGKAGAFMGSDFSNYDIGGGEYEDWTYALLGEEEAQGRPCFVVEARARDESVVEKTGYLRVIKWVDKERFLVLRSDHYDKDDELFKRITMLEVINVEGIWFESVMEAENLLTGHRSRFELQDIKVNQGLSDELFDPNNLGKHRDGGA